MTVSTGAKVAIGVVVMIMVLGTLALAGFFIYRAIEKKRNTTVPQIGSGAISIAAGAATPNDECSVNGVALSSAFVRYSIIATSKEGKTARFDQAPLQISIKALTRVVTIDVAKLENTASVSLLRMVLQSNNFVANEGGVVLTQSSNIGHNLVYTDSQVWPICAQFNVASS